MINPGPVATYQIPGLHLELVDYLQNILREVATYKTSVQGISDLYAKFSDEIQRAYCDCKRKHVSFAGENFVSKEKLKDFFSQQGIVLPHDDMSAEELLQILEDGSESAGGKLNLLYVDYVIKDFFKKSYSNNITLIADVLKVCLHQGGLLQDLSRFISEPLRQRRNQNLSYACASGPTGCEFTHVEGGIAINVKETITLVYSVNKPEVADQVGINGKSCVELYKKRNQLSPLAVISGSFILNNDGLEIENIEVGFFSLKFKQLYCLS